MAENQVVTFLKAAFYLSQVRMVRSHEPIGGEHLAQLAAIFVSGPGSAFLL